MTPHQITFQYGQHSVTIETGEIARQATSAVMVSVAETVVLVTVVGSKQDAGGDFFPLTVDYQERTYAAGKIPGSFYKREGKPSEKEILTSRLIDRPIRPLFADGFCSEVQIVATVLSLDPEVDPDVPAIIGTSAALALSGLPFNGPLGAARVGYINGEYVLNPTFQQLTHSDLDLVVAGTANAVLMVESEAKELNEEVMLGAVLFGHEQMQMVIQSIQKLANVFGVTPWEWQPAERDTALVEKVRELTEADITAAYQVRDKLQRRDQVAAIQEKLLATLCPNDSEIEPQWDEAKVKDEFAKLEKDVVRGSVLAGNPRIDGRDNRTVRPISVRTGLLPRTHGSALFTRGETQALVTATLGTEREAQVVDALEGERKESFMLHYNFPPFCVGEVGRIGTPKRREIGHGRLAKRGVQAVMPNEEAFPYSVRLVSEITESNGSSSMASVCGSSLALMDAAVPISASVAGIAMGLIKDDRRFVVLSDIMGDEDHLGDMDFKVAGTRNGVTALQMDIKIDGITKEIMQIALAQARDGRFHILDIMDTVLSQPRTELSTHAPRITSFRIHPDKIRDVIGKGGATIQGITRETNTSVDIDDDGVVKIAATDLNSSERAKKMIESIVNDIVIGDIYEGKVTKLADFGAFVNLFPGKDGLVHISQIAHERIQKVSDKLNVGDVVQVKVLDVDRQGRIKLSMKALLDPPQPV